MTYRYFMPYILFTAFEMSMGSRPLWSQVQAVPVGDTVRVWAPDEDVKGAKATVLPWIQRTATFASLSAPTERMEFPFGTVTRLEVLRGRDTGRGIVTGFAAGGTLGLLLGAVIGNAAVSGCRELLCELDALGYAVGGLLIGGVVGAAVGAANPPDRWTRVDLPTSAGFPEYRKPFHQTTVFKIMLIVGPIALGALASGI